MIPPDKMIALWDDGPLGKVERFTILPISEQSKVTGDIPNSAGACDAGWLKGGDPLATPLGLFARLVACYGFADRQDVFAALREFAKVDGQGWATELLKRADADSTMSQAH